MVNVYSQDEMDSSKVREKKSKVAFLTTLTAHIEHDLGVTMDLNPSKVVAGLEADKTRYLFQLLVVAATKPRNLMPKMEIEMPERVASLDIEGDLNATETEEEASFNHHQSKDDSTNEFTKSKHVDKPSLFLQKESKESDQTEANQPTEDYQDNLADLETKENSISKTGMDKFVNDDTSSTLMQSNPKNDNDAHEEMNIDTTKLSGHEGNQSSDFQNNDGVSMKNDEESKTDRATRIDSHMAHNKIQKPNRRKNEESIQQLFFGLEEDDIDKDSRNPAPAKARPKTARRKPPKVKERENQNNQNLISRSTRKKPVIFRDDEADDQRKDDTTDEAKMDDLLDTHNLRK